MRETRVSLFSIGDHGRTRKFPHRCAGYKSWIIGTSYEPANGNAIRFLTSISSILLSSGLSISLLVNAKQVKVVLPQHANTSFVARTTKSGCALPRKALAILLPNTCVSVVSLSTELFFAPPYELDGRHFTGRCPCRR